MPGIAGAASLIWNVGRGPRANREATTPTHSKTDMRAESTKSLAVKVALAAIVLGVGCGVYYYLTRDSRAIAYYKARLLPQAGVNHTANADKDALVKLGWLVRRDIHLSHQGIKTNAALEVFAVAHAMQIELKEPAFFGVWRADSRRSTEITVWAYREDMPAVARVIARFDSAAPQ